MITQRALNYAKILLAMDMKEESISTAKVLLELPDLSDALANPSVKFQEKEVVIDAVFSKDIQSFIKVLCVNQMIASFSQVMEAYEELVMERSNVVKAKLVYAVLPEQSEVEQIKVMLKEKYKKDEVVLELEEDISLIGGIVLRVGNTEYDKSVQGALKELQKSLI